jgi:replicative DNA helicase
MLALRLSGTEVNPVTVADKLKRDGEDERPYLLELSNTGHVTAHPESQAEIVKRCAILRAVVLAGHKMVEMGETSPDEAEEVVSKATALVLDLAVDERHHGMTAQKVATDFRTEYLSSKEPDLISPPDFANVLIAPGEVVVLAAHTSVGKTAAAIHWADEWAKSMWVRFFEFEMSEAELFGRIVAKHSAVPFVDVQRKRTTPQQGVKVLDVVEELQSRKLILEDTVMGTGQLFAKLRRFAATGGKVAFIDHLGLVPLVVPKGMTYAKAVGAAFTNPLKRLARETGLRVVLLSQFRKEQVPQVDRFIYPTLDDLRDSGEIAQDADKVCLLYRYPRYEPLEKKSKLQDAIKARREEWRLAINDDRDILRFHWAKYRNGPCFYKHFAFTGALNRFQPI